MPVSATGHAGQVRSPLPHQPAASKSNKDSRTTHSARNAPTKVEFKLEGRAQPRCETPPKSFNDVAKNVEHRIWSNNSVSFGLLTTTVAEMDDQRERFGRMAALPISYGHRAVFALMHERLQHVPFHLFQVSAL